MNAVKKIAVHAHYLPHPQRTALLEAGHAQPDGFPQVPPWSVDEHVDAMDRLGIAASLLSISSPGVYFGDQTAARDLAREMNEIGRRAVVDHPVRFGLFAPLPLPDIDAAMAEIAYCCDHLDVNGFALLTNVGGTHLGVSTATQTRSREPSEGSGVHPPDLRPGNAPRSPDGSARPRTRAAPRTRLAPGEPASR